MRPNSGMCVITVTVWGDYTKYIYHRLNDYRGLANLVLGNISHNLSTFKFYYRHFSSWHLAEMAPRSDKYPVISINMQSSYWWSAVSHLKKKKRGSIPTPSYFFVYSRNLYSHKDGISKVRCVFFPRGLQIFENWLLYKLLSKDRN